MFRMIDENIDEKGLSTLFQIIFLVIIMFILALMVRSKPRASHKDRVISGEYCPVHTNFYQNIPSDIY
jgi:hypothetical protein